MLKFLSRIILPPLQLSLSPNIHCPLLLHPLIASTPHFLEYTFAISPPPSYLQKKGMGSLAMRPPTQFWKNYRWLLGPPHLSSSLRKKHREGLGMLDIGALWSACECRCVSSPAAVCTLLDNIDPHI